MSQGLLRIRIEQLKVFLDKKDLGEAKELLMEAIDFFSVERYWGIWLCGVCEGKKASVLGLSQHINNVHLKSLPLNLPFFGTTDRLCGNILEEVYLTGTYDDFDASLLFDEEYLLRRAIVPGAIDPFIHWLLMDGTYPVIEESLAAWTSLKEASRSQRRQLLENLEIEHHFFVTTSAGERNMRLRSCSKKKTRRDKVTIHTTLLMTPSS
jgi:hypothetical protein